MKNPSSGSSLRILGTLFFLAFYFNGSAQCVGGVGSTGVPDVTLQTSGGTGTRCGLAFNPIQNLYYSVNGGQSFYPIETFPVTGGSALSSTTQGVDYRGYWWNSSTGKPEGNTYSSGGIYSNSLDGSSYATSTTSLMVSMGMPHIQSCGAGDIAHNLVLYYNNGNIHKYNRTTGAFSSSLAISGLPVATSNLNPYSIMYTGITGAEVGVYDGTNKRVYFINYTSGAYVSTFSLQSTAPSPFIGVTFCNGRVFLFDGSQWLGYPVGVLTTGTQTNVSCNGGTTGAAQIAGVSGTSPYTYAWSPSGGTASSATNLSSGTYTATITDANGCTGAKVFTITQPSALSVTTLVANPLCNGGGGSATLSASGGTSPYTYTWSGGGSASVVSSQPAGTYTANVTDANNCSVTNTIIINEPSALITNTAVTPALCFGSNGSATLNVTGGTGAYTYTWSNGASSDSQTLLAGVYTATVTDANNCSSSQTFVITEPTALNTISTYVNALCNGANGSATLNTSGGTGAYTYSWSSGSTSSLVSLPAGTYTATVTDANNCVNSMTIPINQPSPIITNTAISHPLCFLSLGSATAIASGGTAPYTYSWTSGATANVATLSAGFFTVTVTDANACTNIVPIVLYQPSALTITVTAFDAWCNGGMGSGGVFGSGGSGFYTYNWSNGGNAINNPSLAPGNHTVTVTDANNCSTSQTFVINQPSPLVLSASTSSAVCFGQNGTATLSSSGGTISHTYSWSTGATGYTASLPAGAHTATVTDFHNCTQTVALTITQPPALVVNSAITNPPCFASYGSSTVTASGGTAPYTYTWSNGLSVSSSTLYAGTYTVTAKDAHNCTTSTTLVVTQPAAVSPSVTIKDAKCYGAQGGATVAASGGTGSYSVVWSNGLTGSVVSLSAGVVSYTVYDAVGCMGPGIIQISQPAILTATIQQTHSHCSIANSTVTVPANGGTGPYTYYWTGASGTSSVQSLAPGTYSVQVVDANNCSTGGSFVVNPPAILSATVIGNSPILCYGGTSNVTVALNGGTTPYTYTYNGSASTSSVGPLPAGTQTILVKDGYGCIQTLSVNITQPPQFSPYLAVVSPILCNGGTAVVQVTTSGGVAPYTYTWTNTANTGSTANMPAGNHITVVKDANGCTGIFQYSIGQPPLLTTSVSASPVLCYGGTSTVNVTAGGGTPTYSGTGTFTVHAGSGSVTVTDANGCNATAQYSVSQPALISSTNTHALCNGESFVFGQQTLTATGTYTAIFNAANTCDSLVTLNLYFNNPVNVGTTQNGSAITANASNATYQWINCETNTPIGGETSQIFNVTQDGSYAVIVTENGCTDTSACMIYSTVGIKAYNKININMRIQPNPGTGQFILTTNETADLITISDITGKEILSLKPDSTRTSVDLTQQENGIYFVTLIKGNGRNTAKLVINR